MGKDGTKIRTTISGYYYYVGMHLVTCHSLIDAVRLVNVGKYSVWEGNVRQSATVLINRPRVFGEEEGGVKCYVDFEFGEEDQDQNPYLVEQLGIDKVSAFRGVTSFVLNQVYVGKSPHIKPWSFFIERTNTFDEWRPDISAIFYIHRADEPGGRDYEIHGVKRTGLSE